jgi:uncharacterized membrane protein
LIRAAAIVRGRPRLFIGIAAGVVAELALLTSFNPLQRGLIAWDFGCGVFLLLSAVMFSRERSARMAADAKAQEEGEWTLFAFTVAATFASFAAIIGEFSVSKDVPAAVRGGHVALVAVTLLVSWLMTHTIFAFRYAHEYYQWSDELGAVEKGLEFPGDLPPDYWDFFYFAIVLGMTFQVSDVQITSRKLRRVATLHGLLGFLFNTVILALSVNIGASLLS